MSGFEYKLTTSKVVEFMKEVIIISVFIFFLYIYYAVQCHNETTLPTRQISYVSTLNIGIHVSSLALGVSSSAEVDNLQLQGSYMSILLCSIYTLLATCRFKDIHLKRLLKKTEFIVEPKSIRMCACVGVFSRERAEVLIILAGK